MNKLTTDERSAIVKDFFSVFGNVWEYEDEHEKWWLDKIDTLISEAYEAGRKSERKEIQEELEITFDGCHCGFHGYLVLPDCEKENHGVWCARCVINSRNN